MDMIKILIVEDELITAQATQYLLEKTGYSVTAIVSSEQEVIESIEKNLPDLILLDIHLHGRVAGIKIAQTIKKSYAIPIIYLTQINDLEIFAKAKETFPQNYITKPFADDALIRAVELAIHNHVGTAPKPEPHNTKPPMAGSIFVPGKDKTYKKIFINDILYIKADGAYSHIYLDSGDKANPGCITVSISSNHVLEQLSFPSLFKVHRSYHVNIEKITSITGNTLFINEVAIPVADDHKDVLFNKKIQFLAQNPGRK